MIGTGRYRFRTGWFGRQILQIEVKADGDPPIRWVDAGERDREGLLVLVKTLDDRKDVQPELADAYRAAAARLGELAGRIPPRS